MNDDDTPTADAPAAPFTEDASFEAVAAPLHRADARRAARLATKAAGDADLAAKETIRRGLLDASVLYTPRKGETGYAAPPAESAVLSGRVVVAHNSECADIECVVGYTADDEAVTRVFTSCFVAGTRDTKAGDPGTFEVV